MQRLEHEGLQSSAKDLKEEIYAPPTPHLVSDPNWFVRESG